MSAPYPPPPPPAGPVAEGPHLPGTNLFMSIRTQLTSLEQPTQFKVGRGPILGFLLSFIVAGLLAIPPILGVQYGIQPALSSSIWVSWIFIAPLVKGIFLFLGLLIVGYFVLGVIPNRRYGAAFGALAGAGYGIFQIVVYAAQSWAGHPFWYFMIPIEELILSVFLGIGAFTLVAKAQAGKGFVNATIGLPLLFFLMYLVFSLIYYGIGTLAVGPYWGARYFVLPLYLFILRDFLGGHFNLLHFFERLPEQSSSPTEIPPPPSPP